MKNNKPSNRTRKSLPSQSLVEFALALPVLLLLLFGLIEFARLFSAWLIVENSARTAARYASTGQFNTKYCQPFVSNVSDSGQATQDLAATCDLSILRSNDPGHPELIGQEYWEHGSGMTPLAVCAKLFTNLPTPVVCVDNDDLKFEDVVGAMQD